MDHAAQWPAGICERCYDREVRHFVDIDSVGLEVLQRGFGDVQVAAARQEEAFGKNLAPAGFAFARGFAMEDAQGMATLREFGGREIGIDFGPSHRAETFMDKKQSHLCQQRYWVS